MKYNWNEIKLTLKIHWILKLNEDDKNLVYEMINSINETTTLLKKSILYCRIGGVFLFRWCTQCLCTDERSKTKRNIFWMKTMYVGISIGHVSKCVALAAPSGAFYAALSNRNKVVRRTFVIFAWRQNLNQYYHFF